MTRKTGVRVFVAIAVCASGPAAGAQQTTPLPVGTSQVWHGVEPDSFAGWSLAQGVVGGNDSQRDLIVGAPGVSLPAPDCDPQNEAPPCVGPPSVGRVYILYGGVERAGSFDLTAADVTISGNLGESFGVTTAVGNILSSEGGAPQDLLVGAETALYSAGTGSRGAVYLFAGGFAQGASLTSSDAELTILGRPGMPIGRSLAAADLNNDGYGDIVIGSASRFDVIYGSPSLGGIIDLSSTVADVTILGLGIGGVLTTGDVNGDGVVDLLMGAPFGDASSRGAVYVVYGAGSGALAAEITLPGDAGALFLGIDPGDTAGSSVGVADVDGDGRDDILIGAPYGDGPDGTRMNAGEAYVIWGTGSAVQSRSLWAAPVVFFGPLFYLGRGLNTGDLNFDGTDDVLLVGSSSAEVYYGRSRDAMGIVQPDGRRFVDLARAGQGDRRLSLHGAGVGAEVFESAGGGGPDIVVTEPRAFTRAQYSGKVYFARWTKLTLSTEWVRMAAMTGESGTGYFEVRSPSPVDVAWHAADEEPWLAYTPTGGSAVNTNPAGVYLTASAAGLAPGAYATTLTVASTDGSPEMSLPVAVTFDVLSRPTIVTTSSFPGAVGAPVTFTASVTGGQGVFEYKFWRFKAGAGWTMARDYASSPSWTWTPDAGEAGDYHVQVWVRTWTWQGWSSAKWDAWANSEPYTVSPTVGITSLTSSSPSPIATGTPVTWTLHTRGGLGPLQYKFWRYKTGAGWTMARDWSELNSYIWVPGPGDAGAFQMQAWVRQAGNAGDPDAWSASEFTVADGPIQAIALTADRPLPVGTGVPVTWTAHARGGTPGPVEYRFWRYNVASGVWSVVRDYSTSNEWSWTPGYHDAGTYILQAWMRSAGSSASYETYLASGPWTVGRTPVTVTSLIANIMSPQPRGTSVYWTTQVVGGSGALEYKFWMYDATDGSWFVMQQYGSSNSVSWRPSPGTHWVQVWVRTVGSGAEYEAWANSAVLVIE